jgi:hypothetical protein
VPRGENVNGPFTSALGSMCEDDIMGLGSTSVSVDKVAGGANTTNDVSGTALVRDSCSSSSTAS